MTFNNSKSGPQMGKASDFVQTLAGQSYAGCHCVLQTVVNVDTNTNIICDSFYFSSTICSISTNKIQLE